MCKLVDQFYGLIKFADLGHWPYTIFLINCSLKWIKSRIAKMTAKNSRWSPTWKEKLGWKEGTQVQCVRKFGVPYFFYHCFQQNVIVSVGATKYNDVQNVLMIAKLNVIQRYVEFFISMGEGTKTCNNPARHNIAKTWWMKLEVHYSSVWGN